MRNKREYLVLEKNKTKTTNLEFYIQKNYPSKDFLKQKLKESSLADLPWKRC